MPRSLPFELQEMILRRLGRSFSRPLPFPITRDLVIRALLVCCRVCKAWLPISRSYLLKVVALYSGSQLERIIPTLSSSQDFAGRFVKELSLEFIESNQRPFHHLVPHYLATKLPSIEALDIRAGESEFQRVFPIHTSLILHLRQFRTLRSLHIDQYSFPTFWDLRSIVVSLPALGQLGLSEVTWTRRSEDHRNIPRMLVTSHCLSRVIVSRCPSPSEMIWFWATSSRPRSTSDINARTLRTSSFPTLTVHDAGQIENISQQILEEDSTTQWEWDEAWGKRGSCKLICLTFTTMIIVSSIRD